MLPESYRWIEEQFEPEGDPWLLFGIAQELEKAGNLEGSAIVYDRAFGIDPAIEPIRQARARLLDSLAVVEHGIRFRYVPAGPFLMGSRDGESDEQPLHPVWSSPYWLSQTPISWEAHCRLLGWSPPPDGSPANDEDVENDRFSLFLSNRIRLQYCEDETTSAGDWHAHDPRLQVQSPGGEIQPASTVFGTPPRTNDEAPWGYSSKPVVAVGWYETEEICQRISTGKIRYSLPTEAQWEKAARGGLIGMRYPWGDDPPSPENCDFGRFHDFSIRPMTTFAANGYGLYAMSGCIWEWTQDWYDRQAYQESADRDPRGPARGKEKVLRGGCWADCPEVVRVTFRMSRAVPARRSNQAAGCRTPTIGYRLCRTIVNTKQA